MIPPPTAATIKQVPNTYFLYIGGKHPQWINLANVTTIAIFKTAINLNFVDRSNIRLEGKAMNDVLNAIAQLSPHKCHEN